MVATVTKKQIFFNWVSALPYFYSNITAVRAEKTRNVTQRDWPVLTKLWTGKMNIAITEISNIFP